MCLCESIKRFSRRVFFAPVWKGLKTLSTLSPILRVYKEGPENKWKIPTKMNNVQALNLAWRKTFPIITNILDLTFSTYCITPQIATPRAFALKILNRLRRFRNLATHSKKKKKKKKLKRKLKKKKTIQPTMTLHNIFTKHYFTHNQQKTSIGSKQSPRIYWEHYTDEQNTIQYIIHKKQPPCN